MQVICLTTIEYFILDISEGTKPARLKEASKRQYFP